MKSDPLFTGQTRLRIFLKKSARKKGQGPNVNNGTNATSHEKRKRKEKSDVLKLLCFFNQNGPPEEKCVKRRRDRGREPCVNRGTERQLSKRRKIAMHRILCKNQGKVRFGSGKEFQEKRPDFGGSGFRRVPGGGDKILGPGNKEKPNLEPLTRGVFGKIAPCCCSSVHRSFTGH